MDLSFIISAGLSSAFILRSEARRTHDHILLPQIRDSPNLEDQVPVFISHRNRVTQLYPQALGSLSVAFYDSQGTGDIENLFHYCRDAYIMFNCLATNLDTYCYTNGLPIVVMQ
jgi:hypothetical protein